MSLFFNIKLNWILEGEREREIERERKRNISLPFPLFMHSLVASCEHPTGQ